MPDTHIHNTFHITLASVGETHFDGVVLAATLPGMDGIFTVLPHHEPLVTTLRHGTVLLKIPDGSQREFSVDGGVVECSGNRVVVLL